MPTSLKRVSSSGFCALKAAAAVAVLGLSTLAHAGGLVKLCMEDRDIRPWITRDGGGLNVVLLDRVAATLGIHIEYQRLPWKRCLDKLKANQVDGAFGASFKPERLAYGVYPGGASPDAAKRLNLDRYILVCRRDSGVHWDGKVLGGLRGAVGTQLGYSVADDLRQRGIAVDEGAPGANELMHKLLAGHVAAAAMLEGEARTLITEFPEVARTVQVLPHALVEKPYYLLLSHAFMKAQAKRADAIWNTIEKVRESKDYQALEKLTLQQQ